MSKPGILEACRRAGGQTALRKLIGVKSQGSIADWIAAGYIPAPRGPDQPNRILDVEQKTGVHRHYLNSTVYPDPPPPEEALVLDGQHAGGLENVA